MKIKFVKKSETAHRPTKGSEAAAGYDLYADLEGEYSVTIDEHKTVNISSGLAVEIPDGYFGAVFARSGISVREGLRPATCVSVIDSDYRGVLHLPIHNDSDCKRVIEHGERIAQIVIMPHAVCEFEEVDELGSTERGEGGFGSTGKH